MIAFARSVLAMLVIFRGLDLTITGLARLPAASYARSFFSGDLVARGWHLASSRVPAWLMIGAIALLVLAAAADRRMWDGAGLRSSRVFVKSLLGGWDSLEEGSALRGLVLVVSGVSAWVLSCYPLNLYFGQLHLADRLLLIGLWAAISWRPIAVLPFALVANAIAGQFTVPLGSISWTEMAVVLHFPVLFGAYWLLRAVTGERQTDTFVFAWCCLAAATYWTSGLGKLRVDWLSHPHLSFLFLGAHANGWLGAVEAGTIARVADGLARFSRPLMFTTLAIECSALFLLWRRWSLVGFVILATLFHLGAAALAGIFFWKWITIDTGLLVYLLRGNRLSRLGLFTPGRFALSVAVIGSTPIWMQVENLTWFDTPLTYSMRFEGVDERGVTYPLPAGFFRPYSDAIVLSTFPTISPYRQLTGAMGVSDRRRAEALEAAGSAEEIFAMEAALGRLRFDSAETAAFDDFVARYAARARCAEQREPFLLRLMGPPRHLWTLPVDASLTCDVALAAIRVYEQTMVVEGDSLRLIRRRLLRVVEASARGPTDSPER